jgi:hypothetical protein
MKLERIKAHLSSFFATFLIAVHAPVARVSDARCCIWLIYEWIDVMTTNGQTADKGAAGISLPYLQAFVFRNIQSVPT